MSFTNLHWRHRLENITPEQCREVVSEICGIPWVIIASQIRVTRVVQARQLYIYILDVHLNLTSTAIGELLNLNSSTVIRTVQTVWKRLQCNSDCWLEFQNSYYEILQLLTTHNQLPCPQLTTQLNVPAILKSSLKRLPSTKKRKSLS